MKMVNNSKGHVTNSYFRYLVSLSLPTNLTVISFTIVPRIKMPNIEDQKTVVLPCTTVSLHTSTAEPNSGLAETKLWC